VTKLVAWMFGLYTKRQARAVEAFWRRQVYEARPASYVYNNTKGLRDCTSLLVPNDSQYRN